jgi:hypothetical protein
VLVGRAQRGVEVLKAEAPRIVAQRGEHQPRRCKRGTTMISRALTAVAGRPARRSSSAQQMSASQPPSGSSSRPVVPSRKANGTLKARTTGRSGATRPRHESKSESEASSKDAICAPFERLSKELTFFGEMQARRFRFMTLFGNEAAQPFLTFLRSYNEIHYATQRLLDPRGSVGAAKLTEKYEALIGWTTEEEDPVKPKLDEAVAAMERLCRPVLGLQPAMNTRFSGVVRLTFIEQK